MNNVLLRVRALKKSYRKDSIDIPVIKGIDLEVLEQEFITIMGPSGAGKSTLLHILGTLDQPTDGEIYFGKKNVRDFSEEEMSRFRNEKVGFVFQFYHLLSDFTVLENIMIPLLIRRVAVDEAKERASRFAGMMGLAGRETHKPGELSGGEQQRVAIARALVNEPVIILADEPTGNLDRKTGQEVLKYILTIKEEISSTLVLVTHDPEVGILGTRRLHMVDGELSSFDDLR